MGNNYSVSGDWFNGHEVSEYGKENGYVDYACLAAGFNAVLCNDIMEAFPDEWELENGSEYEEDEDGNEMYKDVFQLYIVDDFGAETLKECTDELVWYNDRLGLYVWGVTHIGTNWKNVLTNIKCNTGRDE